MRTNYQDIFDTFAKGGPFILGRVDAPWEDGQRIRASFRRTGESFSSCQCCGSRRLKVLYPLQAPDQTWFWVGSECLKHLQERGLVAEPWPAPVVTVESW